MAAVLAAQRAQLRARHRHAQPAAAGDHAPQQALAYREPHPRRAAGKARDFEPLMTLYLTDDTPPEEIARAQASGQRARASSSTRPAPPPTRDAGVTRHLALLRARWRRWQRAGMPLLVHGEVTDPEVDVFDREAVFIERVLRPLRRATSRA